ncbi:ankyrin repeat domain-containing protein [Aspergillus mulundensis]|uniref:Uncharacterized protein n=1 Tax=Aspergillus mulundensis TaxID=1810919 RepID=A0A3D8S649_9EURO|nr:hypothetical protein DSM5745_05098 [Aspergillus mulundensis]RDW81541.1 hypothetical protein DSM5745_05098 [Aspergillus mulundensis]
MSPSPLTLPLEIMIMIGKAVDSQRDLNALAQTSKALYPTLSLLLYRQDIAGPCNSLFWAAKTNNTAMISRIIDDNVHVDKTDKDNMMPLCYAARFNHIEAATLLVEKGCRLEKPLLEAVRAGHEDMVRLILDFAEEDEIDVIVLNNALEEAASGPHDNGDIVQMLIDQGAETDLGLGMGHDTPLIAAAGHNSLNVAQVLLDNKADIEALGYSFQTALQAAVVEGHLKMVELLLANGAEVNMRAGDWGAALTAAQFGADEPNEEVIDRLIDAGAHPNQATEEFLESWNHCKRWLTLGERW